MMLSVWMLVGCELLETQWEPVTFVDEGRVCLAEEGADLRVTVEAPACLSSSCSRNIEGSCQATVEGSTISVTSDITWEQAVAGPNLACTDDCGLASTSCTIDGGLPAGTYTLDIGGEISTLALPGPVCTADR